MDKFKRNKLIVLFNGAISNMAKKSIRQSIRKILNPRWINVSLEMFASRLNPKIRGWINYYGKYFKWRMIKVFSYLDGLMRSWIAKKYKITSKAKTMQHYCRIEKKVLRCSITGNLE
jgi:hypothetical protein